MTCSMASHSILRVGPLHPNAVLLRSAIVSHFRSSIENNNNNNNNNDDDNDDDIDCLLTISNRYFDATVLVASLPDFDPHTLIDSNSHSHDQEEGIILVFDSNNSSQHSFDTLQTVHDSAEQMKRAGELLRLCVGVSLGPSPLSDGTKTSEEEYSRRVLWCLDRGYEYVEADLTGEGRARGHEEREKEGFARIVEAISTCMWSSHIMKSEGKRVQPEQPNIGDTATDSNLQTNVLPSSMDEIHETTITNDCFQEETTESKTQEIAFRELDYVLNEAKKIREASKSNSMTVNERREKAGQTAMRLMGLLDKLGFDDDSDSENHSKEDQHVR